MEGITGPWSRDKDHRMAQGHRMEIIRDSRFACGVGNGQMAIRVTIVGSDARSSLQKDRQKDGKSLLAAADSSVPYHRSENARLDRDGECSQQDVSGDRIWSLPEFPRLLPLIPQTISLSSFFYYQADVSMADSFADLWSTAAPTSSAPQKPRKLNDLISSTTPSQPPRPQNDVFSLLAASSSSSNSTSRTSSPGIANQSRSQSNGPKPTPPPNGDAFSGLLTGPFGNGPAGSGNLSMAEQAAKAEKERKDRLLNLNQQAATKAQSSTWSGLDSLGTASTFTPPQKQATLQKQDDFDWVFDTPASTSSKPTPPPPSAKKPSVIAGEDDDWGLSDFGSEPTPASVTSATQQRTAKPSSIWDLEDVDPSHQPSPPPRKASRPNSPGEGFDFGNREDVLLDNDSNDEDGILGSLSKPVSSVPSERPPVRSDT